MADYRIVDVLEAPPGWGKTRRLARLAVERALGGMVVGLFLPNHVAMAKALEYVHEHAVELARARRRVNILYYTGAETYCSVENVWGRLLSGVPDELRWIYERLGPRGSIEALGYSMVCRYCPLYRVATVRECDGNVCVYATRRLAEMDADTLTWMEGPGVINIKFRYNVIRNACPRGGILRGTVDRSGSPVRLVGRRTVIVAPSQALDFFLPLMRRAGSTMVILDEYDTMVRDHPVLPVPDTIDLELEEKYARELESIDPYLAAIALSMIYSASSDYYKVTISRLEPGETYEASGESDILRLIQEAWPLAAAETGIDSPPPRTLAPVREAAALHSALMSIDGVVYEYGGVEAPPVPIPRRLLMARAMSGVVRPLWRGVRGGVVQTRYWLSRVAELVENVDTLVLSSATGLPWWKRDYDETMGKLVFEPVERGRMVFRVMSPLDASWIVFRVNIPWEDVEETIGRVWFRSVDTGPVTPGGESVDADSVRRIVLAALGERGWERGLLVGQNKRVAELVADMLDADPCGPTACGTTDDLTHYRAIVDGRPVIVTWYGGRMVRGLDLPVRTRGGRGVFASVGSSLPRLESGGRPSDADMLRAASELVQAIGRVTRVSDEVVAYIPGYAWGILDYAPLWLTPR